MDQSPTPQHDVVYAFIGYRCSWRCSCGTGSSSYTKDTYLGARRKSLAHLKAVNGDINQPYRSILFHEMFPNYGEAIKQQIGDKTREKISSESPQ